MIGVVGLIERLRAAGCVFAEDEARLLAGWARSPDELEAGVARRIAGEPLEHVVGWAEFCGLRVAVGPGVFVPRHRTELMVDEAVALVRAAGAGPVVLDLCCGSGAVGAAVLDRVPGVELHATDVEPAAIRCARRNLAAAGAAVYEGDLYDPLPAGLRGRVDVLLANVPYVPSDAIALMPPEARVHEPRRALDGGPDGLDVLRRVAASAPQWLAPGGHLLTETGERQSAAAAEVLAAAGLHPRVSTSDDLDATVVVATRATTAPAQNGSAVPGETNA